LFGPGVTELTNENPTRARRLSTDRPYGSGARVVLYDPAMGAAAGTEVIRAWRPPIAGVREVFHAQFTTHAYPSHTHDAWTVFIVDDGAIRYDLDGRPHGADRVQVGVLPPHVAHDGRPARDGGFRDRVLYLEPSVIGERLIGPAVDRPSVPGRGLRREVAALHDALACPDDRLEAETRLAFVVERIRRSLGDVPVEPAEASRADLAEQLRAWLDRHLFEATTIGQAADAVGVGPTQLARAFSTVFGIAPHGYVLGRRVEAARERILGGQALADVAAEVGFHDQAHLSRHFGRHLGTTPGRYRAATRPVLATPATRAT
jgi:AraC-like DNA-binding protein